MGCLGTLYALTVPIALFLLKLNLKYSECSLSSDLNLLMICRSDCGRQALLALGNFPEVCT